LKKKLRVYANLKILAFFSTIFFYLINKFEIIFITSHFKAMSIKNKSGDKKQIIECGAELKHSKKISV
jgi:hypothetical protein